MNKALAAQKVQLGIVNYEIIHIHYKHIDSYLSNFHLRIAKDTPEMNMIPTLGYSSQCHFESNSSS